MESPVIIALGQKYLRSVIFQHVEISRELIHNFILTSLSSVTVLIRESSPAVEKKNQ